ncbi:MAG: hypothetical protein KDA84_20125, partial [Planctomycetaceae bacterium]|nr:hypothetical protein [Planctomycetaceae bacterium]
MKRRKTNGSWAKWAGKPMRMSHPLTQFDEIPQPERVFVFRLFLVLWNSFRAEILPWETGS